MKGSIHSKRRESGQSMIELALTITVLMVLLAGTVDLGHAFFTWLALRDAAQEGATYGAIDGTATLDQIKARVRQTFADSITDPGADIVVDVVLDGPRCLGSSPSQITVTVLYLNFPISMPFLGALIGDTIVIRATINDTIISPVCGT